MNIPPSSLPPSPDAMPLDPLLKVEIEARRARPPYRKLGLAEVRRIFRETQAAGTPGPAIALVEDDEISDAKRTLPVRIYRPMATRHAPLIVYLHGGGFVIGDLDTHDRNARGVAAATGAVVMSVGYRLAPEHPFPAAVEDALFAVRVAAARAAELGASANRIFVAGDSAGATLALITALTFRDGNGPRLAGVIAVYPQIDATGRTSASYRHFGDGSFGLSADDIAWFREQYRPDPSDQGDWRLAPGQVRDLGGLPPILIVVAAYDALRDEGIAFATRLKEAGVPVKLHIAPGVNHGFMGAPNPPAAAGETLRLIGDWVAAAASG
jgi:acetyl esterase